MILVPMDEKIPTFIQRINGSTYRLLINKNFKMLKAHNVLFISNLFLIWHANKIIVSNTSTLLYQILSLIKFPV